jgi:hypothetical protein
LEGHRHQTVVFFRLVRDELRPAPLLEDDGHSLKPFPFLHENEFVESPLDINQPSGHSP